MDEESWNRITRSLAVPEDLQNASDIGCRIPSSSEKSARTIKQRHQRVSSRKERRTVIFQTGTANTKDDFHYDNLRLHSHPQKATDIENENIRQPLACITNFQQEGTVNVQGHVHRVIDKDTVIQNCKFKIEALKEDLLRKEQIIEQKSEEISKLELQLANVLRRQLCNPQYSTNVGEGMTAVSLDKDCGADPVLDKKDPTRRGTSATLAPGFLKEKVGNNMLHDSSLDHQQNENNFQVIMYRLDQLEKRMEEVNMSIPKEIQQSIEKYLKNCRFKCNESQHFISCCASSTDNQEYKEKLWNKSPAIQPRANLSSNMRLKFRATNNCNDGEPGTGSQILTQTQQQSSCFCQTTNTANCTNSENCTCNFSAIESQIRAMEKVVAKLKLNFMKMFKKVAIQEATRQNTATYIEKENCAGAKLDSEMQLLEEMDTSTTKRKLEDDELVDEEPVAVKSAKIEETVQEDNVETEFCANIENLHGLKFVTALVRNSKSLCKLFSSISKIDASYSRNIQEKCHHVCTKYRSEEKRSKFLRKVTDISCEGDLFKTFLKYGMRDSENGNFGVSLIKILTGIFEISSDTGEIQHPVTGIQMIVSHSKATEIFLENHSLSKVKTPKGELPLGPVFADVKTTLLKLWLILLKSFTKVSKEIGTENDKKILENSVPYLMQMYDATLSPADRTVFEIIKLYSSKKVGITMETMPLFGPKCFETPPKGAANPLYAHSTRANSVLGLINERKAFQTAVNYKEDSSDVDNTNSSEDYDMRFILPLLCHALDEKNICNGALVVTNGWIYFIVRGLALEDKVLRSAAFLGFRRLILNFLTSRGFRLQDVKIWLHFLQSVKRGFTQLGECKVSTLLSMWMVHTWEVIRQPSHPMYQRVTHFLLAKPVIELTILPEFVAFFNATDGNKESREWIMSVLASGLKSKEDWKIAQKLPTVKFLCSSFILEQAKVRKAILQILSSGAAIPEMAQEMIDKHSLPLWIANVSLNDPTLKTELEILFNNLVQYSVSSSCRDNLFRFVALKHNWNYATL